MTKTNEISIDTGKIIGSLMKPGEEADYNPESSFHCDDPLNALEKSKDVY